MEVKCEVMSEQVLNDVLVRKFWLGELSPEEQGRIEELAFANSDNFRFVETVEDDLIDDFIQGALTPDELTRFEDHFLKLPGRRENLHASRIFHEHLDRRVLVRPRRAGFNPWGRTLRWSAVAAVFLLLVFALWFFIKGRETERPPLMQAGSEKPATTPSVTPSLAPSVAPTATPVRTEVPRSADEDNGERPRPPIAAALLLPGATRDGEGLPQLSLPAESHVLPVELHLETVTKYENYEVVLQDEAGNTLQSWPRTKSRKSQYGNGLHVQVPVELLKPQQTYSFAVNVTAKGVVQELTRYYFEIAP